MSTMFKPDGHYQRSKAAGIATTDDAYWNDVLDVSALNASVIFEALQLNYEDCRVHPAALRRRLAARPPNLMLSREQTTEVGAHGAVMITGGLTHDQLDRYWRRLEEIADVCEQLDVDLTWDY